MAYNICKVKNIDTVSHTYQGQEITAGSTYTIQDFERTKFAHDSDLLADITADKAQIWDSAAAISSYDDQIDWLKDNVAKEVMPVTPKNEHTLTPIGLGKKHVTNSSYCGTIDLSNKSTNTFNYANASFTPAVGHCLTEDSFQTRAFITAVNTGAGTLTVDDASGLTNGNGRTQVKPLNIDYKLPDTGVEANPYHMLWGLRVRATGHSDDDFAQCKIVDVDNILGYGAGTVLSYYDETWLKFFDLEPLFRIPDNSPGPIYEGLYLRMVLFITQTTGTTKLWWDYLTTLKDS